MREYPDDWKIGKVSDFYEIGSSKRIFQSDWRSSGIPFYRARELVEFAKTGECDNDLFIENGLYNELKTKYGVPTIGDMLVTGVGTLGVTYVVRDNKPFYFKDGNIIWFKKKEGFDTNFLQYLYSYVDVQNQINDSAGGSTVGTYTINNAGKTKIPVPPLSEQKRIAEVLGNVDKLIENLEKRLAKKRAIKQGAMQELLTGKKRLPGFTGEWSEKRFDECFTHIQSRPYQIQAATYLDGGVYDVVDQGQSDVIGYTNDALHLFRVPKTGVIIFGDHTRIVKFRLKDFVVGADGTQLLIGKNADTRFLSFALGILNVPNLGYSRHFKYLKEGVYTIPPSLSEQRAIAKVLSDMDDEISVLERKLEKVKQVKQGMMQDLLTGRVRLRRQA